jgi:serine/threonine protein kinase HipA of HipAB toxin-antitoxin module
MTTITLEIDKDLLAKARQYADEHNTTLEALLAEHLALLADRAGRRLTARELMYVDCAPSEEVKARLRADFQRDKGWREKAGK